MEGERERWRVREKDREIDRGRVRKMGGEGWRDREKDGGREMEGNTHP